MEVFELIVEEKISVWRRSHVKVEAESLEEAVQNCIESGSGNALDIVDSEYLYETEEYLAQDEYLHPVTVEVMDEEYNILGSDARN